MIAERARLLYQPFVCHHWQISGDRVATVIAFPGDDTEGTGQTMVVF
jgi:hypothetical protein